MKKGFSFSEQFEALVTRLVRPSGGGQNSGSRVGV
jgi:hypothetical protein